MNTKRMYLSPVTCAPAESDTRVCEFITLNGTFKVSARPGEMPVIPAQATADCGKLRFATWDRPVKVCAMGEEYHAIYTELMDPEV